ncbi:hypothetical protein ASPZODRAFT_131468 [Penicilliopsis zonata CBS 506.65]|uniref:Vta1/callose synthase N-terminal domain-containing protein n=1 Tax=Penicilliopsis zonata CBS 506.65 TaxID=1073090 RepID=A0A1L9SL23_9EURO|nr:hypothetical protein ASPZODRAFT_131468 [Penicilliopsis zonata CBS 506.65]OJJ47870.1 hypothetical protein ASPZODRAFT_131468 [Penicilliopsis zonata CBS 506.65]
MPIDVPATIRSADIGRYAIRAAQIEQAKPIVAYWCNFHVVNQIIDRGLHTSDEEVKLYTMSLVDQLEQFKTDNPDNDAITDSVTANAYVEEFGLEVFGRADNAMRANKVTRQTADTFQAAATFLELCQVWGPLDPELAAKVKFAKYHALRIVKAIKAGEDPNSTNPAPQETDPEVLLDAGDINALETQGKQPSVEEVPDEADRLSRQLAGQSTLDESLHPSRSSSIPPSAAAPRPHVPSSLPTVPSGLAHETNVDNDQDGTLKLPSAPATLKAPSASSPSVPDLPDTPSSLNLGASRPSTLPDTFHSFPSPSALPPSHTQDASPFYAPSVPPVQPPVNPVHVPRPSVPVAQPSVPQSALQAVDDQSIALAQKHARWAVSALTFDDVNTAIKELRNSLRCLGADGV